MTAILEASELQQRRDVTPLAIGQAVRVEQIVHDIQRDGSTETTTLSAFTGRLAAVPEMDGPLVYHVSRDGEPTYIVPIWDRELDASGSVPFSRFVRFAIEQI